LHIKKIIKHGGSKQDVAERLKRHHHDILVVGTPERRGIGHLFGEDLGEYLARYVRQTTLYVPLGAEGFVNSETGALRLNTILMPVAEDPSPEPAFGLLQRLLHCFGGISPQVHGIHAGDAFPFVSAASLDGLSWAERLVRGSIEGAIVDAARELRADLIVMSTNGRDTLSQKIMGSITEHVLRFAPCPVLAVAVQQS
jgi:nucleotide-binding universal stress UspA family protein